MNISGSSPETGMRAVTGAEIEDIKIRDTIPISEFPGFPGGNLLYFSIRKLVLCP
jgi:hypothetical protein